MRCRQKWKAWKEKEIAFQVEKAMEKVRQK
jgi:hypothetical protein